MSLCTGRRVRFGVPAYELAPARALVRLADWFAAPVGHT